MLSLYSHRMCNVGGRFVNDRDIYFIVSNALTFTFLKSLKLDLSLSVIKEGNRLHVSIIRNNSFSFTNVTFIILEFQC